MPVTGNFWTAEVGLFDPDDVLIIPFDFSVYIDSQETAYASHIIEPTTGLLLETVGVVSDIVKVRVTRETEAELVVGKKYPVAVQVTTADGQKKTKTLFLKIKQG